MQDLPVLDDVCVYVSAPAAIGSEIFKTAAALWHSRDRLSETGDEGYEAVLKLKETKMHPM